jgi:hypothetical protein
MTFSISQPSINTIHSGHFSGLLRSMYLEASIKSLGVILMVWWGLSPLSTIFQLFQWRLILLVEETGVTGENHRPVTSNWQTCSHNVVHLTLIEIRTHNIISLLCYIENIIYLNFRWCCTLTLDNTWCTYSSGRTRRWHKRYVSIYRWYYIISSRAQLIQPDTSK